MRTKLLSGLLVSAALFVPGVALADPPNKCPGNGPDVTTPGDANKILKDVLGTPGQNTVDLPANEFAQGRNDIRKEACPPSGQS